MQELVAGVEKISFDSEAEAEQQRGARPLPLAGVDVSPVSVAVKLSPGGCGQGCGDKPAVTRVSPGAQGPAGRGGAKPAVCKHWLRGLCRRGDSCDFLHDYDTARVPECYFYSRFGECSNKDCPFPHVDGTASAVGCPWYDRGFCRRGPLCKYKHTRRVMCSNYLVGFCPEGPKCKFV
ncbi:CPSF4 factor, partial [Malurus elegans]|nr:CPSF4 factor [Malurus elegans]